MEVNYRTRAVRWVGIITASFLLIGCAEAPPTSQTPAQQAAVVAGARAGGQSQSWSFDVDPIGGAPLGATALGGTWSVRPEADTASRPNALCQTGWAQYPTISLGNTSYGDAAITVRFKPVSGDTDRAAGIVFRVQDRANYYILRADALEDSVDLYRYQDGRRVLLKEISAKVASGQWQKLRVEFSGDHLRGYLNDQPVVEASDDAFSAGRIGLWTEADSVACFDDVEVRSQ